MSKTKLLDGVKKVTNQREFFIIALVAVVYIVAGSFNENFLSKGNQLALLMSVATLLVLGVGVTPLMIAGCFDMSIASILALSGGVSLIGGHLGLAYLGLYCAGPYGRRVDGCVQWLFRFLW